MTEIQHHTADEGFDQFIPVRKNDIIDALVKKGAFASDAEREKFRQLCQMLASIYHYEYFALLERLRHDYYYFSPEIAPHAAMDRELIERSYADLVQSLDKVLKDANFVELPHREIADAHRRRTVLRVEIKAPLDDFREVRFYWRGRHTEQFEVAEWFGLRRRKVEAEVYDDVVLLVAMKSQAEIASRRELRTLERRKIRPGSVLLKYFRNIASSDLNALFPNVRVIMSNLDKLVLGIPAIAGGIPILLNIYASITVLFLVIGFYLGFSAAVEDKDMKTALAALSGLVALGTFAVRQWVKYQRQSLKYQTELTDNIYYRNINNNAGIFDYVIGAAEEQECKEAFLAYHFLHAASSPPMADELDGRIEAWLRETFGVDLDFKVEDALAKLEGLGLLKREGERLAVPPLDGALAQLRRVWDDFFPVETGAAAE
ncbi:MAG: TMEM143 family protein [Xanthobacteraceae bacterium]